MKRFSAIIALLALMLLTLAGTAAAEGQDVATPTDLDCPHEHTRTIIYFYDSPAYVAITAATHRVYGPAVVRVVCKDCGEVLSEEEQDNAEEIRPHSFKNGACALCGYRQNVSASEAYVDLPGERTIYAQQADGSGLLSLTLTQTDLDALQKANVNTVVVRGQTGSAAVALDVAQMRDQTAMAAAGLYLEMEEQEDGSLFAALFLDSSQHRTKPENKGITLRFYREEKTEARFSLAAIGQELMLEVGGSWDEHGFWSVGYAGEGNYFMLQ